MAKVRWGVISTADIGLGKVLPAMQKGQYTELVAISSRSLERAQAAARQLGIPKAYGSYEELLADPEIEAIYNPLPNNLHVEWSIKALEAGKHVLCEKPIGMSAADGQKLVDAAKKYPKLKVMEAFMYRHHPQWQRARQMVNEGKVGELRTMQAFFSYFLLDPNNVRNIPATGGGGLMDVGCYCISTARHIFGAEPKRVLGMVEYDPQFKTDRLASGILDFGRGWATFTCATQLEPTQRVNIVGTKGRIEIEIPFNQQPELPAKIWYHHDGKTEEILFDPVNQYTVQGDRFSQAVLNDTPVPTPIEDSVLNMKVIEGILQSAKSGAWV
jgi:predicted dehydrogenase